MAAHPGSLMSEFRPTPHQLCELKKSLMAPGAPWKVENVDRLLAHRFDGHVQLVMFGAMRPTDTYSVYEWNFEVLRIENLLLYANALWEKDDFLSNNFQRFGYFHPQECVLTPNMGFTSAAWARELMAKLDQELAPMQAQAIAETISRHTPKARGKSSKSRI